MPLVMESPRKAMRRVVMGAAFRRMFGVVARKQASKEKIHHRDTEAQRSKAREKDSRIEGGAGGGVAIAFSLLVLRASVSLW